MRRRDFIKVLAGSGAAWPAAGRSQQSERMRLVGVLMTYAESDPYARSQVAAFRDELRKLGWREGDNLRIEVRWAAGDADNISRFAKELIDLRADAILAQDTFAVLALARETRTIPVVFTTVAEPKADMSNSGLLLCNLRPDPATWSGRRTQLPNE